MDASDFPETRAAWRRLKAAWGDYWLSRREHREMKRRIKWHLAAMEEQRRTGKSRLRGPEASESLRNTTGTLKP